MSTSASTPEPSSNWIPTDPSDDQVSLSWFAYDSATNSLGSSNNPCTFDCSLHISKGAYDFGKWKRPDFVEHERIVTMTTQLSRMENELIDISNKIGENKANAEALKLLNERLKELAQEHRNLINEMQTIGFTIVPMTPLPAGPAIRLTLSSVPEPLVGSIESSVISIRASRDKAILGLGQWLPPGSQFGNTKYSADFILNGNYGLAKFIGEVNCCGEVAKSNEQILRISGMCQGEAQRDLELLFADRQAELDALFSKLLAFAALMSAVASLAANLIPASAATPLVIPVLVGIIVTTLGVLAANLIMKVMRDNFNNWKKLVLDTVQPYINSLPPCP